jgi:hypothetical protein
MKLKRSAIFVDHDQWTLSSCLLSDDRRLADRRVDEFLIDKTFAPLVGVIGGKTRTLRLTPLHMGVVVLHLERRKHMDSWVNEDSNVTQSVELEGELLAEHL